MTITDLQIQWIDAKEDESRARSHRLNIERKLAAAASISPASGRHDLGRLKATAGTSFSVDSSAVGELSSDAKQVFRVKYELDKKAWDAAPESVRSEASSAITERPSKVAFEIKEK